MGCLTIHSHASETIMLPPFDHYEEAKSTCLLVCFVANFCAAGPATGFSGGFWWLVRVTLVVAFAFGRWQGPINHLFAQK